MKTTYVKRQRGYQLGVSIPRGTRKWKQTEQTNKQINKHKPKQITRWPLPKQGVNAPEAVADANGGLRPCRALQIFL